MHVSYFGSSERRLFGAYHPPEDGGERNAAVLLCGPAPQEYMQSHWVLRKLAARLATAGFHVLRFDYYGTGDSGGDSSAGSLEQWRADVVTALQELRDAAAVRRVSVVGFRLGATLAAQAPIRVRDLVLWEPVVAGTAYLDELRASHERCFAHCLHPPRLPRRGPLLEILGCPLPESVEANVRDLQLGPPLACRADRVAVVASEDLTSHRRLIESLQGAGLATAHETVPEPAGGDEPFLLSSVAQQRIAELLTRRAS